MRKKILAVVAATVITTLAFTGCGKSVSYTHLDVYKRQVNNNDYVVSVL